ncbi:Predicted kinase, aminoglycoside phosphotransferase (APT) family [Mycobacterium rhizamassiliense]|uniref:Predicted kinase, aminoglycoside phosphotransferase (APT) family n=1 Tax=Mycobacterium rhizamassiliense TaxID=1841860 RepID=A0A2U3NTL0_9MYCO|nr:phosphotransferase family protein [Mycobacterium rhizamassiliense]SPM34803.1 Predicted kinase, aminoglycoside phosphotransferase (APT) family [Mycobacterium rhizamassiliense]
MVSPAVPLFARPHLASVDKDAPSESWIEYLRRRYPTESELDRVLNRRQRNRATSRYTPPTLDTLTTAVTAILSDRLDEPFTVSDGRWLSGGASKLQMAFTLDWVAPGTGRTRTPLVLRMEPAESMVETSRLREFQVIKAFQGVVPVPPVYWLDAQAEHLPYPGLVYGMVAGSTKPSAASVGVSGLGTNLGPQLRGPLAQQMVRHLAAIHTFDFTNADLDAFDRPELGTQSVEWAVNWWSRAWDEDCGEDIPLMRLAAHWLRTNMPPVERLSIVHGDFRTGNYLFTEHDRKVTAILDWELARIGDRHQDLAWIAAPAFGHLAEDGATFLASGLLPTDQLYADYERISGLSVDPQRLHYYRVFNAFSIAVLALGTGYRIAGGAKTHQDITVAWLIGIGSSMLHEIHQLLETGA